MKAGLRSVSMECGGQCVMNTGIPVMPELCADTQLGLPYTGNEIEVVL